MATENQTKANRANSKKSTGPKSKTGRATAAQNNLRHGVLAQIIVIPGESPERFAELLATFQAEFQPRTAVESVLVETLAVARWRQMRLWMMESANLTHEIENQLDESSASMDSSTRAALAFRILGDNSRSLDLMNRYETRFDRQYNRSLTQLLNLRERSRFAAQNPSDY
jgi:hypothetical protein